MIFQFGDYLLDTTHEKLTNLNGETVAVHPKALQVLDCLARHAPEVVSRDTLQLEVWGHQHLCPTTLSQTVYELRRALNDDAQSPSLIGTRHGEGYYLLAQPMPLDREPTARPRAGDRRKSRSHMTLCIVFAIVVGIAGFELGAQLF